MGFINNVNVDVRGASHIVPCTYKTVILKKNITKENLNVLTQAMLDEYNINTKFVIKWDYVLKTDIIIPNNCILEFDGGSISGNHTIIGNNTSISSNTYSIFGFNIEFGGTWKVEKVLLNWFAADANGYWNNALYKAIKYFKNVTCVAHSTYQFDDTVIDLRSSYEKIHIDGCMSTFIKLHLSYNIGSNNYPIMPGGSVGSFENIFENIYFIGSKQNNIPIIHTAQPFKILNCNFTGANVALGIAPCAIDHIAYENGYIWDIVQFIACYNYNIEPENNSYYVADFFFFKNVHADSSNNYEHTFIEFRNTGLHAIFENCLHPRFKLSLPTYFQNTEYQIVLINCHFENTISLINSDIIADNNHDGVEFDFYNSYIAASALPYKNWLENCTFTNCEIHNVVNGNSGNIDYDKIVYSSPRNIKVRDYSGILTYDAHNFDKYISNKLNGSICPGNSSSYYVNIAPSPSPSLNYAEGFTAKYFFGLSQRKEELYNDEETPTVVWSNDIAVAAGNVVVFDIYLNVKRSAYLHLYKLVNGVTYRAVVPFTKIFSFNRPNGNNYLPIMDCNKGVWGVPWSVYEGDVKYVRTLVEKSVLQNTTIGNASNGSIVAERDGYYIDIYKNVSGGDLLFNLSGKASSWVNSATLCGIFDNEPVIDEVATSIETVLKSATFDKNVTVPDGKYIAVSSLSYNTQAGGSCTITFEEI